jgi:hypothetical protein
MRTTAMPEGGNPLDRAKMVSERMEKAELARA